MAPPSNPSSSLATPATPSPYPYPNNLNTANFITLKLFSTNYLMWETQALSLVQSQDLLGFVTGETPAPPKEIDGITNPALAAWTRTDGLVKGWIIANLSEEAIGVIIGLNTAADVWKALATAYSQNSQAREFELLLKIQEKKKETTSLNDHIKEFKSICDQLNAIGKPVPDARKVFSLLSGLGPRYESFSTAMPKPPVPSYNDLIPLLLSHELRNKSMFSENVNPNLAFVGQRSFTRYHNKRGHNSSFSSRGRGFTQASSRPTYNNQNLQSHRQAAGPGPHLPQQHNDIYCQICKKKGHAALGCWHRFDNSYQKDSIPQALAALNLNLPNEGEWLLDTGATSHITEDPGSKHTSGDGIGE